MGGRTAQLQIRVTPQEKTALKRLARAAGLDVSAYVLRRSLPQAAERVAGVLAALRSGEDRRFAMAAWDDLIAALPGPEFAHALHQVDLTGLDDVTRNYLAAIVELAAYGRGVAPPAWTCEVEPLEAPYFATSLRSMRSHLLRVTAVPFRRRNLFTEHGVVRRV